jgi:ElaB/YqjD/DUF883 family membrane-anchored ribosome-binding protein
MDKVMKERLAADVNAVLVDAEEMLKQAAHATGEEAKVLRSRAQDAIGRAKDSLVHIEQRAVAQTRAAAHATDNWVHDHPWTAVGIAAGVGFLVGLVVNRK